MGQAVESILFLKDKARYNEIATCATQFNAVYNGNNIIQDVRHWQRYKRPARCGCPASTDPHTCHHYNST